MSSLLFLIIGIIAVGILLVIFELLIFPGTTIFGFLGAGIIIVGIYIAYTRLGATYGHISLVSTLVLGLIITILAFRSKTWNRASLDKSIDSRVEQFKRSNFKVGDTGLTISRLAPIGNIKINNEIIEATARGDFIDQNEEVEVIKIKNNILVVKKLK